MDNQKQELIAKLKEANNVLVTVSANPSVDQLAACIGLTLLLNKLKKHATAVFSGEVPSTLQFLKPEETLEKTTDSLRDFIVSLDKAKADKLRYKVEDNVVKIFITPYKTSITEADLDFSQGDFNIDVVICLGVDNQTDLDQAIIAHGRILHDATVASVSVGSAGELGTLNWVEPNASSLSELAVQISDALGHEEMDGQIATAFLTGIVAETEHFSNEKTTPTVMQLSAQLMTAGANQQLVASELQAGASTLAIAAPAEVDVVTTDDADAPAENNENTDGTLEVGHPADDAEQVADDTPAPKSSRRSRKAKQAAASDNATETDQPETPAVDEAASAETETPDETTSDPDQDPAPASRMVLQPPSMGGQLTANSVPEGFDPSVDPLTLLNSDAPMLNRVAPATSDDDAAKPAEESTDAADEPVLELPSLPTTDIASDFEALPSEPLPSSKSADQSTPPAPVADEPADQLNDDAPQSLADLEIAVDSPHLQSDAPVADDAAATEPEEPEVGLDAARDAVMAAVGSGPDNSLPEPTQASGSAGYLDVQDLVDPTTDAVVPVPADATDPTAPSLTIPSADPTPPTSVADTPSTAPPVPPPLPLDPSQFTEPKR